MSTMTMIGKNDVITITDDDDDNSHEIDNKRN